MKSVDDINSVIDDLVSDHIATGQLLVKMSDLTSSYEPPIEACGTWRLVYQRLKALEVLTHEHVRLETYLSENCSGISTIRNCWQSNVSSFSLYLTKFIGSNTALFEKKNGQLSIKIDMKI